MSSGTQRRRPNAVEYIAYSYGRVLPDSMREWVREDLTGKGAAFRTVMRFTLAAVVLLSPLLLIHTTLYVHASMTLPILIPFIYFSIALNKVYRRHRLGLHGIDPGLIDKLDRERNADYHRAYEARFGPRPPA